MNYSALILAVGKDASKGKSYEKALAQFDKHTSVLEKTVSRFLEDGRCKQIVIVTNSTDMRRVVEQHDTGKILHVKGGSTRIESVLNGLTAVLEDVVLIHDGVRPWIRQEVVDRILDKMETEDACVAATEVRSPIITVNDGYMESSVKTKGYYSAQTPQAFKTSLAIKCYALAQQQGLKDKDDAAIISKLSDTRIAVVKGDARNVRFMPR
ncbi:2-C-methyl-D-erythritol 4-phosphate cytidylyltransferase [Erysipelothrix larvae]|uniref:2-C-methyl-D-erythritol 4-phosphate cytidylyltransferase n=1 Tax=Erysipelothrix larvae TaxID=1514105 RepID=A0A109UHN2_9FIRM|nr:2-C-methyl-D-erythritol 4-phosphate cytidylyltransferase [Erysipelothrix larvae]AMC94473.1 2-C-methyl-D-erythritol 4-phosphate cytidylyltransferase [Erysipelothrix larvae]